MPGVVFHFEDNDIDVYSGRRIDLDAWNNAIRASGDIDRMIVVNRTEQPLSTPDADLSFSSVPRFPVLKGRVVQLVCPWSTGAGTPLWSFDHAADWYCFGPAKGWDLDRGQRVTIPQAGRNPLHAVHIASAVFLHRYQVIHGH